MLAHSAMLYGALMGLFWIVKYLFFMFGFHWPFFDMVYWGLTFLVPVLAYVMTLYYKHDIGGHISFLHAWQFGFLLYLFAALLVSLLHFVFYRFVAPPDYITNTFHQTVLLLKEVDLPADVQAAIDKMEVPSPILMVFSQLLNNIIYGIIFSIPVALLACRKNA